MQLGAKDAVPALRPAASAAVLLCGHGSRDAAANDELRRLVDDVRRRLPGHAVCHGFLSLGTPDCCSELRRLAAAGTGRTVLAPLLLAVGNHAVQDLPRMLEQAAGDGGLAAMRVLRAGPLADHEGLLRAARARIDAALAAAVPALVREHAWLLCLGSGSAVAEANAAISTIGSRLTGDLGFGGGSTGFAGGSGAGVVAALAGAHRAGYRNVVVLPYFLFRGRLLRQALRQVGETARESATRLVVAGHLGNHPGVIDAVLSRIAEAEQVAGAWR